MVVPAEDRATQELANRSVRIEHVRCDDVNSHRCWFIERKVLGVMSSEKTELNGCRET